mmetsp:Transcript_32854/g.79866  ORF Transcript_32854/g.79866 Transcript_32854/m.79866 type:complete len:587 (-) Transcript_32854:255-2015(-)
MTSSAPSTSMKPKEEEQETTRLLPPSSRTGGGGGGGTFSTAGVSSSSSCSYDHNHEASSSTIPIPPSSEVHEQQQEEKADAVVTYASLLATNLNYRYFWLSYVTNHLGEWMSYLASITFIQDVTLNDNGFDGTGAGTGNDDGGGKDESDRANTLIAILIIVKLLPNVFAMPLGGVLADKYDRRKVQIGIDMTCSLMVMLFLVAVHYRSVLLLYFATFCQETLSGLYIPSNSSILPLLSSSERELEKMTTLSGLTWSLMAAIGSSTGGLFVVLFGIKGCFLIDSLTYMLSASFLTFGVKGNFVATEEEKKRRSSSSTTSVLPINHNGSDNISGTTTTTTPTSTCIGIDVDINYGYINKNYAHTADDIDADDLQTNNQLKMFIDGLRFVIVEMPMVGAFALLKGSAAAVYGAADVLNVSFSERGSEDNPHLTSLKLGSLFGSVGLGCIVGSMISDQLASLSNPNRIFRLCLLGFLLIGVGYVLLLEWTSQFFAFILLAGLIRSIGSSLIWIDSTLLLQKFSPTSMLGRVQSLDYSAALLGEAVSALGGGLAMDNLGLSEEHLSLILLLAAIGLFAIWSPLAFKTMPTI